jgi:DNA-binding transcriptional regulator PaaX
MPKIVNTSRNIVRRAIVRALKCVGAGLFEFTTLPLTIKYKGGRLLTPGQVRKIVNDLLYEGELKQLPNKRYRLTPLGVARVLPIVNRSLTTDGQIRIIVFDVPESERRRRDRFRRHIKLLGFKQHQKSVWVSRYNCEDWLTAIIDYHQVGNYVSLYIGNHIW